MSLKRILERRFYNIILVSFVNFFATFSLTQKAHSFVIVNCWGTGNEKGITCWVNNLYMGTPQSLYKKVDKHCAKYNKKKKLNYIDGTKYVYDCIENN